MARLSRPNTPRMIDIAERAGVSRMAVSAVLMGTGGGRVRVSQETAERIRAIAAEIGYRPNPAARQLAGQRSGVIAVIANSWQNYPTQKALACLHEAAQPAGLRVLAIPGSQGLEPIQRAIADLRAGWIDGLVYLAFENQSQWPAVVPLFQGLPRAIVSVEDLDQAGLRRVVSDVTTGAADSWRRLVEIGRRRPVLVTEEADSLAIRRRMATYQSCAAATGLPWGPERIIVETRTWSLSNPDHNPLFDGLARRLWQELQADALLCDTDFTAVGLSRALRRIGARVPEDVAVFGWGDLQFAAASDPPLTTVTPDFPALLGQVVQRLAASDSPTPPREVDLIPTRLVIRESA